MALTSNRKISLTEEDREQKRSQRIDHLDFSKEKPIQGWLTGVHFPVLLFHCETCPFYFQYRYNISLQG